MDFQPVEFRHRELIRHYQKETPRNGLNYLFEVIYLYRNACEFELCEHKGFLLIKSFVRCTHNFFFPLGKGNLQEVILDMEDYSRRHRCPFSLFQIRDDEKLLIEQMELPGLTLSATPEEFEYLYLTDKLLTLSGKHLQPKRNHINALLNSADCHFEPFDDDNVHEARRFEEAWCELHFDDANLKMSMEREAVAEAFAALSLLPLRGGVLRVDGKVEGFSMGCELDADTFIVLFEKANHEVRGAYPLLNREFVRTYCQGYTYVNREEDGGDEGLRQAKHSYSPLPFTPLWCLSE